VCVCPLEGFTFYVFQVTGSSGMPYTLFPHVNYCPCPAYRYQVISTQKFLTCKHILAARLAEITQKGRDLTVSVEELTRILCAAANFDKDVTDHYAQSTDLVQFTAP
jgi:predicted nucleic acid-binding Zn finger protein